MSIFKNIYFWAGVSLLLIFGILYYRKYACQAPSKGRRCSFWTGKPIGSNDPRRMQEDSAVPLPGGMTGSYTLTTTAEKGAPVYIIQNDVFVKTGTTLPKGLSLKADLRITYSGAWYNTAKGWLNGNDVGINTQTPH